MFKSWRFARVLPVVAALTLSLAACGGNVTAPLVPTASPTPPGAQPTSSAVTTQPLVANMPISIPPIGGFSGSLTFGANTVIPSGASVKLQSFVGAAPGAPVPQSFKRHISAAGLVTIASFTEVFTAAGITAPAWPLVSYILAPNDPAGPYTAETFDQTTGKQIWSLTVQSTPTTEGGNEVNFNVPNVPFVPTVNDTYVTEVVSGTGTMFPTPAPTTTPGATPTPGAITEFSNGITPGATPNQITAGGDGNLWFSEQNRDRIARITPVGVVTEFQIPTANAIPLGVAKGADGNIWFTEQNGGPLGNGAIGRITPAGTFIEYSAGISPGAAPTGITSGPDGNLWFTELLGQIGRITTAGVITEFGGGISPGAQPFRITTGADNNLWFSEQAIDRIARITTAGVVTEFSVGITPGAQPRGITAGPDGNLWFSEQLIDRVARITTAGAVTEFSTGITPGAGPNSITSGPD
ncbi:MAG: hypothetical protein M3Y21_01630, partial [Candidatus Eremiobacteraeota bacterium]|nr:hypothetical protein [Candidatus Eremiobacteraeota bacterium]